MSSPDAAPILDLIDAFRRSKVMFTALTLGVFDRLHEGAGTAAELAQACAADAGAMERLLDACAALGLMRKQDGRYANEAVAEKYLWSGSADTLSGYIRYSETALYPMWGHLDDALREGGNRWRQTFGLEGGLFSHFFRTERAMREFLKGMHGFGMLTSPRVVEAFDLSRFGRLADLGGATGHLAIHACERYPGLRAVVFDLAPVVALAREQVAASAARDRIEVVAGDFFEDALPEADLYTLGRILHDWTDEKIGLLLRRIAERLPRGGALLIAEKLLNKDGVGPVAANLQDLNMLVVAEGRERSLGAYAHLLRGAGFEGIEGRRTGTSLDAIFAVKP